MKEAVTNGQTWPPPPAVENPLAAHDSFLTALIRRPAPQSPSTRTRLVWLLHRKTGLGLGHCHMVVYDFCQRHDILSYDGIWTLCLVGFLLSSGVVLPIMWIADSVYLWMHDHAGGHAARLALDSKFDHLNNVVLDPWLHFSVVLAVVGSAFAWPGLARLRREAEEARRKLTAAPGLQREGVHSIVGN